MADTPFIAINHAKKTYHQKDRTGKRIEVHALDDTSLAIDRNETVGLVGESGSGKTTLGHAILHLLPLDEGEILVDGQPETAATADNDFQVVFQDPYSSLNPYFTVQEVIEEPIRKRPAKERHQRAADALVKVGLPESALKKRPRAFSGGQRQRIAIARAIVSNPDFIVLDEPTSALDVSIQVQVIALLRKLQAELKLSYLFITHDLRVVRHFADRIAVMYRGQIVEVGPTRDIFEQPAHPYTKRLLDSLLPLDPKTAREKLLGKADDAPVELDPAATWHELGPGHRVKQ